MVDKRAWRSARHGFMKSVSHVDLPVKRTIVKSGEDSYESQHWVGSVSPMSSDIRVR